MACTLLPVFSNYIGFCLAGTGLFEWDLDILAVGKSLLAVTFHLFQV